MKLLLMLAAVMLGSSILTAAAAADPAVHELPPDEVFTDVNPCTGELTTITQSYSKFVVREGPDAAGGFHVTGTAVGTISTTDGFEGRFTFWFGFNGTSGTEVETFTNSNTLTNGSGQRIVVTTAAHLTSVNGEVVVEHEIVNFKCVGKPA